jgi:hypothetical protein
VFSVQWVKPMTMDGAGSELSASQSVSQSGRQVGVLPWKSEQQLSSSPIPTVAQPTPTQPRPGRIQTQTLSRKQPCAFFFMLLMITSTVQCSGAVHTVHPPHFPQVLTVLSQVRTHQTTGCSWPYCKGRSTLTNQQQPRA